MQFNNTLTDRLIRNTAYNTAGRIWELGVGLFLAPYIIYHLGIERYGIWVIIASLSFFLGFLDFSLEAPLIKYVAEYFTQDDKNKFNSLINTTMLYFLAISLGVIIIGLPLSPLIVSLFNLQNVLVGEALITIQGGIIIFAIMNIFLMWIALLKGIQCMDITNKIFIGNSIFRVIGTVFVLENHYGLPGLIAVGIGEMIFALIISFVVTKKFLPWLIINPFRFNIPMFKDIFMFGIKVHMAKLAFVISFHLDKLLLAQMVSISAVGFYDLGSKICFTARRIASITISALLPAISDAHAQKKDLLIKELYFYSIKYLSLAAFPAFIFIIPNAAVIMSAWMGNSYPETVFILQILAVGYFFNTLSTGMSTFAIGLGKPELEMKYSFLVAPFNVCASILCILIFQLPGAAAGTSLSLIIGTVYFLHLLHRQTSLSNLVFFKAIKIPLLASLIATGVTASIAWLPIAAPVYTSRIHDIIALGIRGITFCIVFVAVALALRIFDKRDRALIKLKLGKYVPAKIFSLLLRE